MDWSGEAHMFCAACSSKADALVQPSVDRQGLTEEQSAFAFEGRLDAECVLCVDEWLAATGHPALQDMLDAEQRESRGRRTPERDESRE